MNRRGFLQLLAGAAAALAVPFKPAVEAEIVSAMGVSFAETPATVGACLIRAVSLVTELDFMDYTSITDPIPRRVMTQKKLALDVELIWDPANPPPSQCDVLGYEWFERNGITSMFGEVREHWPKDLQFMVRSVDHVCGAGELATAMMRLEEVRGVVV